MDRFVYSPLTSTGHFRILELLPGTGQLACRLRCQEIGDECLQYEALSYVWGSDTSESEIFLACNSLQLQIRPNLATALQHIRNETEPRWLWVDAVCINQQDDDERSQQVTRMGDIYTNASRVLIWMGEDRFGEASECFDLIKSTTSYLDRQLIEYGNKDRMPSIPAEDGVICAEPKKWDLVRRLVNFEWFTRVWVLQEIGLARAAIILYGRSSMNWSELVELLLFSAERADFARLTGSINSGPMFDIFDDLWRSFRNNDTWRNELPLMKSMNQNPPNEQSLVDILACTRGYSARDARDHIYAFSAHPSAYGIVSVDYRKSVEEVYTDVACILLEGDHPWTVLSSVDRPLDSVSVEDDWPSWVPRWDGGWNTYWLGYPQMYYRASASLAGTFRANYASRQLNVRGTVLDTISWTSEVLKSEELRIEEQEKIRPVQILWNDLKTSGYLTGVYGNSETQYERAFSLLIAAGRAADDGSAEDDLDFHMAVYDAYKARMSASKAMSSVKLSRDLERHVLTYVSNQRRALHNRRIFRTGSGYLGVGPAASQANDVCVVIRGANVPFILRRSVVENGESIKYKLVGESYVQGVMKGEVMDMAQHQDGGDIVECNICLV